jgi:toxin CptA
LTAHNAPPVVYPLGRSRIQAGFLLGLWFSGVLLAASWFLTIPRLDWRLAAVCVCSLLSGWAALSSWKNAPVGKLAWDGQSWRWESPGYQTGIAEQQLFVLADLQHLMLLRIENQAQASLWLWMERNAMPDRWLDLRRAVYSPQRSITPAAEKGRAVAVSGDS